MTQTEEGSQILSREELDALLALLGEGEVEEDASSIADPLTLSRSGELTALQRGNIALYRIIERFGDDYGRMLSSVHQVRIRFGLKGWEEMSITDLTDLVLPTDRAVSIAFDAIPERGFILLSRPLLFNLLELSFGAQPDAMMSEMPRRPYTGVEELLIRRLAEDALEHLRNIWERTIPGEVTIAGLEPPSRLANEGPDRLLLATLEVEGLAEFSRLRLAIPFSLIEAAGQSAQQSAQDPVPANEVQEEPMPSEDLGNTEGDVLNTPVRLRVVAGTTNLNLSSLAELQVGDVIPLDNANLGELMVRIEGHPKFRAVRGTVGKRLAVQVTERL